MAKKSAAPKVLEAEAICLKDSKGKTRMQLYVDDDYGPVFELFDSKQRPRLTIQLNRGGVPQIRFESDKRLPVLGIGADEKGNAGFSVYHPDGTPAFMFETRTTPDQAMHIAAFNRSGKVIWQSSIDSDS